MKSGWFAVIPEGLHKYTLDYDMHQPMYVYKETDVVKYQPDNQSSWPSF